MKNDKLFKRHVLQAVTYYKELLDANCCVGIPVDKLSGQFGISRNILQLGFMKLYGESIREYKLRIRMERSRALFSEGKDVKAVAMELNYTELRTFSSAFKRYHGVRPTEFCKSLG